MLAATRAVSVRWLRVLQPTLSQKTLSTKNGWRERRAIIDAMPTHTVKQLQAFYAIDAHRQGQPSQA